MVGSEKIIVPSYHILSLLDIDESMRYVLAFAHQWGQAITNPKQFLAPVFQPTEAELMTGFKFYLPLLAFSFLLYAPFLLGHKGDFAEKIKLAASGVIQLLTSAAIALCWHFPFWLLGGGASFSGSYLAYVYAGAPYLPLISIASLVIWGALPVGLRRYAMNPLTAQDAMNRAAADPKTNKAGLAIGSLLVLGIMFWALIAIFSSMRFVHSLNGFRLVATVILAVPIFCLVGYVLKFVQSVFVPPPTETLDEPETAPDLQ